MPSLSGHTIAALFQNLYGVTRHVCAYGTNRLYTITTDFKHTLTTAAGTHAADDTAPQITALGTWLLGQSVGW